MTRRSNEAARRIRVCAALALVLLAASCGKKIDNRLRDINPDLTIRTFFSTWKNRDWRGLYRMIHPNFIQKMRMQKLAPGERDMTDEQLFIHEFERASRENPGRSLRNYTIQYVGPYSASDASVWVDALVNGSRRKVPLTLDGLTLKVDLSRIK